MRFWLFFYTFFILTGITSYAVNPAVFEDNEIAATLCRAIELINMFVMPVGALILSATGIGALSGKFEWKSFVFVAIGISLFRSSEVIVGLVMPGMGLEYGCKCKNFQIVGYDNKQNPIIEYHDLDENCKKF